MSIDILTDVRGRARQRSAEEQTTISVYKAVPGATPWGVEPEDMYFMYPWPTMDLHQTPLVTFYCGVWTNRHWLAN